MHIQVDQSGRIENLTQDSVVAFSNGLQDAIFLHRREKRACYNALRGTYLNKKINEVKLFSACLFLLLRPYLKNIYHITIDAEYPGYEARIKEFFLSYAYNRITGFEKCDINFASIGKKSNAHLVAYSVYTQKIPSFREIKAKDLLILLVK
ncbi:MAG: hypothetical protein A2666_02190 [Parcubacteria group bacterium RIFCSPHIGHO2_01_FULL_47_10b]|nr:MAG: hypothetical protein A2666_02190 [Parcubacteria group bacterium RIFCSPHIGHO2_01_FULL_47_10b]